MAPKVRLEQAIEKSWKCQTYSTCSWPACDCMEKAVEAAFCAGAEHMREQYGEIIRTIPVPQLGKI